MIITRTPFRISFCGGGSDLKTFYEREEGCVLSAAINKYMYISLHPYYDPNRISLKYSKTELVDRPDDIEHRIFRETLSEYGVTGIEITSTADIPAGTGLGSSSSFAVGLIRGLNAYSGREESVSEIADHACDIEINRLKSPIGKQDQYAAAFGGFNFIRFLPDGKTVVEPLKIGQETLSLIERRLMMFSTGRMHDANQILSEQSRNLTQPDKFEKLSGMCRIARELKLTLERDDLDSFGPLLHENWMQKKELASGISNPMIDRAYEIAMRHGAEGGKLLGAGGGGFLLFYCREEKQAALRESLNLKELDFSLEPTGTTVIFRDDLLGKAVK